MSKTTTDPMTRWLQTFVKASQQIAALPYTPLRTGQAKKLTGLSSYAIAHHLRLAGWERARRVGTDIDGQKKVLIWWSPPGQQAPKIPRSHYEWLTLTNPSTSRRINQNDAT